jgi:hypothetical protein
MSLRSNSPRVKVARNSKNRSRASLPCGPQDGGGRMISHADYDAIGGIAQQVEVHLDRVLLNIARKQIPELRLAFEEVDCWKQALGMLVRSQPDGTVTTDIVKADELGRRCTEAGCQLSPAPVLIELAKPEVRVLRPVPVSDRQTRENFLCYSLGHDTLGLVLRRWVVVRAELMAGGSGECQEFCV